jgi:cadmium resistance protein CadD (predicted permease)
MSFSSLIVGALTIAVLHAILPDHWLTFVLVGSAQRWSKRKIIRLVFLAGSGHVLMTTVLGLAIAWLAKGVLPYLGYLETYVTSGTLIILGLVYLTLGITRKANHDHSSKNGFSDKATETSLFLMLTFSPCEAMIPVFFRASTLGWENLLIVSLVATLATISGMVVLSSLALEGYKRIHFPWLEKNERTVIGVVLFALGIFTVFFD